MDAAARFTQCEICGCPHKPINREKDHPCPWCARASIYSEYNRRQILSRYPKTKLPSRLTRTVCASTNKNEAPVDVNTSVYIYGAAGSGKSTMAAGLMIDSMKRALIENKYALYEFTTSFDLLCRIKATFQDGSKESEQDVIDHFGNVFWLCIDDIAVDSTTDWTFQILHHIINKRYEEEFDAAGKRKSVTVFTSNLDLAALGMKLKDDRIPSRIAGMCTLIHKKGKDLRIQRI